MRCSVKAELNLGAALMTENGVVSRIREGIYTLWVTSNNDFIHDKYTYAGLKFRLTYRNNGQIYAYPMGGSEDPDVHFDTFIRPRASFCTIVVGLHENALRTDKTPPIPVPLSTPWSVTLTYTTIP
jgi:hypothetical protein